MRLPAQYVHCCLWKAMTNHQLYFVSKTRNDMVKTKERRSLPAPIESPRVVQDMRTGEGTSRREGPANNDEPGPNPQGSLGSDHGRKDSKMTRPKRKKERPILNIGTWNVQTLLIEGKFELLINEIKSQNINITGISETRWAGEGHFEHDDYYIVYSGRKETGYGGVAIILDPITKKSLLSEDYVSDRIVMIKLDTKPTKTTIIQVYAPTSKKEADDETDKFYEDLQALLATIKDKDPIIIMGDFNAKVGKGQQKESGLGPHGLGIRNERGERLLSFCQANNFKIGNTLFPHHPRRRYTWVSPKKERHQLDYILINEGWASSVLNCKTKPGADHDTDHILLQAKLRIKTYKCQTKKMAVKHDLEKLANEDIRIQYTISTENKFQELLNITDVDQTPEELVTSIKEIYLTSADDILGKRRRKKAKPWISAETIEIATRKRAARIENNRTEYRRLKAEVQKNIRADKRKWLEEQCQKIDEFDKKHQSKSFYRQIKNIKSKKYATSQLPIYDKDKNTLIDKTQIMGRWREYGQGLFCLPEGETESTPEPLPPPDMTPEPPPIQSEVDKAITLLSFGKAPGIDNCPADLIKMSGEHGKKAILHLCQKIWNTCSWPSEWKKQEFVVLHKSGDQKECSNYRTIALISHLSKILLYIILNRLKEKMEQEISDEQAGFRQGRGTADMLCALQLLIEKVNECTSTEQPLEAYIVFIDYSKAFDNVSHPKLFKTMLEMGFPTHLVKLIQALYNNQEAIIRWNRDHTEPFKICKGVRHIITDKLEIILLHINY